MVSKKGSAAPQWIGIGEQGPVSAGPHYNCGCVYVKGKFNMKLTNLILASGCALGLALSTAAQDTSATQDLKDAGKDTKKAATKTAKATKKATKKGVEKTASTTKKVADATADKTKSAADATVDGTKKAAKATSHATKKVAKKTEDAVK